MIIAEAITHLYSNSHIYEFLEGAVIELEEADGSESIYVIYDVIDQGDDWVLFYAKKSIDNQWVPGTRLFRMEEI